VSKDNNPNPLSIETELARQLHDADPLFGSAAPPIYQTSTHTFPTWDSLSDAFDDRANTPFYGRQLNPTVKLTEEAIAKMSGAEKARLFGSGMGAVSAALLTCLKHGDHVITVDGVYGPATKFMGVWLPEKLGVTTTFLKMGRVEEVAAALTDRTSVIYLETPTSSHLNLQDIRAIADLVADRDIKIIVDNSWATPLRQRTLDLGAHLEVHSASKYMAGHSDLIAGVVLGDTEIMARLSGTESELLGSRLSPLEAWLLLRGLRTLPLRLDAHERNGLKVAQWLEAHPKVARVRFPGLESHPQYELAKRQMSGVSSLFYVTLASNDLDAVKRFFDSLTLFGRGVSWGGHESLIFAPAISAIREQTPERFEAMGVAISDMRLAIGLEDPDDLIRDLDNALAAL